ncbi:MAG: hypothetical protein ABEJ85_00510 [Haloarculaceae archaeon]
MSADGGPDSPGEWVRTAFSAADEYLSFLLGAAIVVIALLLADGLGQVILLAAALVVFATVVTPDRIAREWHYWLGAILLGIALYVGL